MSSECTQDMCQQATLVKQSSSIMQSQGWALLQQLGGAFACAEQQQQHTESQ